MKTKEVLDDFYDYVCARNSERTAISYKFHISKLITSEEFIVPTKSDCDRFLQESESEDSFATLCLKQYALNKFNTYLDEKGLGNLRYTFKEVQVDKEKDEFTILSEKEILNIASKVDVAAACYILLTYEYLFKIDDILNLDTYDIDFLNKRCLGKKMSNDLCKYMKEYDIELCSKINDWNKYRKKRGKEIREREGYFFQSRVSDKLTFASVSSTLKNELQSKGLMAFTFEDIRNSKKAELLKKDTPSNVYKDIGGSYYHLLSLNEYLKQRCD
ncbi:tyrosine-type recombinase/integrase [[Eubacterium] hominis]|uniref:tyrosine-type recombinase/integrase n=1 Tax=[Eubacterium] hominis TaxID=2764325 RepID=UPI0022E39F29